MASVYTINKGIARPILFRGLKAQYIVYLAGGLVALLLLFAILYISGLSLYLVLPTVLSLGATLISLTTYLSKRFGEHGLDKYLAKKRLPFVLRFRTRKLFFQLSKQPGKKARP